MKVGEASEIGEFIALQRDERKLTRIELADQTGITKEVVYRLENGIGLQNVDKMITMLGNFGFHLEIVKD